VVEHLEPAWELEPSNEIVAFRSCTQTREREYLPSSKSPGRLIASRGSSVELQLDDELTLTDSLDAALRRIRSGAAPRILLVDLGDSSAPIAEVSAARAVGGADLKLVVLGTVNDVALFRDLLSPAPATIWSSRRPERH